MRFAPHCAGMAVVGLLALLRGAPEPLIKQLTPVLVVEAIEPCLPFWVDRLGFDVTIDVPEENRLGFVALERDGVEIMVQTRTSVEADLPAIGALPFGGPAHLYFQVEDLDVLEGALDGADVVMTRRTTFYGATEIFVRDPCGHIIGFAAPAPGGS
jgi:uncharacterized glyoxalase superfamily protein PhnB